MLGQQQVQGINYAYTLQGWLKAINPAPYTGGSFTLRPDSSGTVVANSAYNLMLDYFNGDFNPISTASGPDSAVSTSLGSDYRPLYNGNISSMGTRIRGLNKPLLYNYQYDQLNRLIHMDAWKQTSTPWSAITKISDYQEGIAYDPNGNIQQYKRNGDSLISLAMDSLNYFYTAGTNKLDHITDAVTATCTGCGDLTSQSPGNYQYDSIGELIADVQSNITNITWTVYGKIASITKSGDTTINFTYDAGGHRISKSVIHAGDTTGTWYVRDAQGNILSVYTYGDPSTNAKDLTQTELDVYGSSRLGMWKRNVDVEVKPPAPIVSMPLLGSADTLIFTRGNKLFELTNHLGDVLSTISDKRYGVSTNDSTVGYFNPDVVSANDYYPFGMLEPGRQFSQSNLGGYRYGFNGKEQDNELKGVGNQLNFGGRILDPRAGRFLSVDPMAASNPEESNYNFAGNSPIQFTDFNGMFKISPFFVKRYPTLARMIQNYLPLLKDNPQAKKAWITAIGFNSDAEGEKAFDDMVTYGKGPWITPTRDSKEWNGDQSLNGFFEPTGAKGEFQGPNGYTGNITIQNLELDNLEAAMKKGNNEEIGEQMFVISVLIMHEATHWGKFKYNCCEIDGDDKYEMGANFEFNAFGQRFSYQNSGKKYFDVNDAKSL